MRFTLAVIALVISASATVAQVPIGSQFLVNSYTTDRQYIPSVSMDSDGDFVIVWESYGSSGSDTSFWSIQGQRYASDGTALGNEFQVNSYTPRSQRGSSVSMDSDGDFVVVWKNHGHGQYRDSIQGQRYASDGTALGNEFQVNAYTFRSRRPAVSMVDLVDADQDPFAIVEPADAVDFVVVWESYGSSGSDTSDTSIQGQLYLSDGSAFGSQFQVNSYTTDSQKSPAVAVAANGDFVVVWYRRGYLSNQRSVQGQRFSSDGSSLGSQFQVNSYNTNRQWRPAVAMAPDGDFVVVWESDTSYYPSIPSIRGQRYASDGSALASEFQVNSYTTNDGSRSAVAVDPNGDFVAVWGGGPFDVDTSLSSVQGQRFRGIDTVIFSDGFESGNLSMWSSSVGN